MTVNRPTWVDVKDFFDLSGQHASLSSTLQKFIDAETAAQDAVCRTEPYTIDLHVALIRRVQRAVAMAGIPLAVQTDGMGGSMRPGSNDPEIRRLEAPYRKTPVG